MEEINFSYDHKEVSVLAEREVNISAIKEDFELDQVDYETLLEEIRVG